VIPATPLSRPAPPDVAPRLSNYFIAQALLIAAFTYVFLANAWLGDDAYITFRVIWNLLHGYGAVFNPGERVQAYTHPLWMFVMSAAHAVTREFFFTALAVSYALSLAAVLMVARTARSIAGMGIVVLWLLSSKAFVDYTSSGLEYPLSYLLLALFYVRLSSVSDEPLRPGDLARFGLLAGLAFVNRIDSVVLYLAPLAWMALGAFRRRDGGLVRLVLGFAIPAGIWLIFATVYYGFPFPNTYYAKVATGIPSSLLHRQGFAYLLNSFAHDPLTLGTVFALACVSVRGRTVVRMSALSAVLYVAYTVSVGGDFMSGRFFAMPFLVAVIAFVRVLGARTYHVAAAGALVAYNLLMPIVPIKTTGSYDAAWPWRSQNGIKDERGHYHRITNVFFFSPFRSLPDHTWMREGVSFRNGPDKVTVQGSIGFYGLMAGPSKLLVDRNALSDALLARLPVSPRLYFEFYAGHYFRDIPPGYIESLTAGTNLIADPELHAYYDHLKSVISGPLLAASRFRSIWYLNAGAGRRMAKRYELRRPVALSIRASNERFTPDAGDRDEPSGSIVSNGRAGYLQMGPGIPMKAGSYRARWVGEVTDSPGGELGFVDVSAGGRQLAKRAIYGSEVQRDRRQIAEIAFVLNDATDHLEYRLWIDGRHPVKLERVELFSEGAGPAAVTAAGGVN
jgi:arabinofuranosyltransferase